jgi:hypothetical protein
MNILMATYGFLIRMAHGSGRIRMEVLFWTRTVLGFGILAALGCDIQLLSTNPVFSGLERWIPPVCLCYLPSYIRLSQFHLTWFSCIPAFICPIYYTLTLTLSVAPRWKTMKSTRMRPKYMSFPKACSSYR